MAAGAVRACQQRSPHTLPHANNTRLTVYLGVQLGDALEALVGGLKELEGHGHAPQEGIPHVDTDLGVLLVIKVRHAGIGRGRAGREQPHEGGLAHPAVTEHEQADRRHPRRRVHARTDRNPVLPRWFGGRCVLRVCSARALKAGEFPGTLRPRT